MPTYVFENTKTGEVFTDFMSISEMEAKLVAEPHLRLEVASPMIVDPMRLGITKPAKGFTEIVGRMKRFYKNHNME